jgi:hypothetical protein
MSLLHQSHHRWEIVCYRTLEILHYLHEVAMMAWDRYSQTATSLLANLFPRRTRRVIPFKLEEEGENILEVQRDPLWKSPIALKPSNRASQMADFQTPGSLRHVMGARLKTEVCKCSRCVFLVFPPVDALCLEARNLSTTATRVNRSAQQKRCTARQRISS